MDQNSEGGVGMNILLLDDEPFALQDLENNVAEAIPNANIEAFTSYKNALEKAKDTIFDVAFLDIQLAGGVNGLEIAKQLKDIQKDVNIIFVTAYMEYALDAYQLHASGYILKPSSIKGIKEEMNHLRRPIEYSTKKLEVHCFGNFEVYYGRNILYFGRSKSKELFAYLIHRSGASVTLEEACQVLWTNDENKTARKDYFRKIMSELRDTLKKVHMQEVLIHSRNAYAVDTKLIDCDYYKFLSGEISAVNTYCGAYMEQYDWAKMTVPVL